MAKFCGKCGSALDLNTGLCPLCDCDEKTVSILDSHESYSPQMTSENNYYQQPEPIEHVYDNNPVDYSYAPHQYAEENFQAHNVEQTPEKVKKSKNRKNNKNNRDTKTKANDRSSGVKLFVTIILSFCLFITSTISLVLFDVRFAISEDNAEHLFDNIELTTVLEEVNPDSITYLNDFYEQMYNEYGIDIDKKGLDDLFKEEEVKEYAGSLVSDFADEIFSGSIAKMKIKRSDIAQLVFDCKEYIYDEYGVSLSYSDAKGISEWILPDGDILILNSDDYSTLFTVLRFSFSYLAIALFGLISALLIFLLIRNKLSQAVMGIGIDFIITGGLTGLIAVLALIPSIMKTVCGLSFIIALVMNICLIGAIISAVVFSIGLLSLLIRFFVVKYTKKKKS